eukprot:gene5216-6342_t
MRMDALPMRMGALPMRMEALPMRMDALPMRMDALPMRMEALPTRGVEDAGLPPRSYIRRRMRLLVQVGLVAFIAYKSAGPVKEMTSAHPWLNFYDNWFFVNAYGVFGFINKERYNLVLSYTHGADLWHPLDFKCYP